MILSKPLASKREITLRLFTSAKPRNFYLITMHRLIFVNYIKSIGVCVLNVSIAISVNPDLKDKTATKTEVNRIQILTVVCLLDPNIRK